MSDSVRPHRQQPTRLRHPWDSPGKNTGVGCHCLLRFVRWPQLNSFNKRTSMLNLKCIEYSFSWLCTSISSVLMESSVIINLNYLLVITITSPNTVFTRCYVWSWELCAHGPIISSVYRWRRQKVKVLVAQSCPILWIIAFQAPLSMEFSRQEN